MRPRINETTKQGGKETMKQWDTSSNYRMRRMEKLQRWDKETINQGKRETIRIRSAGKSNKKTMWTNALMTQ